MGTKTKRSPEPPSLWNVSKYLLTDVDFGRQNKAGERKMPLPVEHEKVQIFKLKTAAPEKVE